MISLRIVVAAVLCVALGHCLDVFAQPAHVILIRHGEKPVDESDNGLSLIGEQRAAALVPYLTKHPDLASLGRPAFIFAQAAEDKQTNSLRPIKTIKPFADSLRLPVLKTYNRDDFRALADELLKDESHVYQGKTVVICWEHDRLAELAQYLVGARAVEGNLPLSPKDSKTWVWPGDDVYGRTWVISFTEPNACVFHDYAQRLLFDDAKHEKK